MKLKSLIFAGVVASAALKDQSISEKEIRQTILDSPWLLPRTLHKSLTARFGALPKRQLIGFYDQQAKGPASTVSDFQKLDNVSWPGAEKVKIRYGPFRIPPVSEKNFQSTFMNIQGMTDTFNTNAKKPCDGDCTLLDLVADLEFADGTVATNKDGAWFHHAVLLNSGPNVIEPNCGMGGKVENIFMSGNEKTTGGFALLDSSIKSGYSISEENKFILTTELMNMKGKETHEEQWVWMTLTYEYLPGTHPNFKQGKTVWMSIGPLPSCPGTAKANWGPSNLTMFQQPKERQFSEHSVFWTAPRDGFILGTGGHQHDGGTGVLIFKNNDVICDSQPRYEKGEGHGMGAMKRQVLKGGDYKNTDIPHIAKQIPCNFEEGIPLKKGDTMHIQANYDFDAHPGMKNKKGELDEVMGIVGTLVAF